MRKPIIPSERENIILFPKICSAEYFFLPTKKQMPDQSQEYRNLLTKMEAKSLMNKCPCLGGTKTRAITMEVAMPKISCSILVTKVIDVSIVNLPICLFHIVLTASVSFFSL